MSLPEHLLVYVSLILGIAVARNLVGLSQLLVYRDRVRPDGIFLAWAIFFIFVPAADWWDLLGWPDVDTVFIWDYFWLLVRPMVLFLVCSLLFTGLTDEPVIDLRARFERIRPALFTLGAVYTLLSVIGQAIYDWFRTGGANDLGDFALLIDGSLSLLIAVLLGFGAVTSNRTYHAWLFPVVLGLFVALFTLGE